MSKIVSIFLFLILSPLSVLASDGSVTPGILAGGGVGDVAPSEYILIEQQEAPGTNGGACTPASWTTRLLNIIVQDEGGNASLSSGKVTFARGTYVCQGYGVSHRTDGGQVRLQDMSSGLTLKEGYTRFSSSADNANVVSAVFRQFTTSGFKEVALQQNCTTNTGPSDFGLSRSYATEVYAGLTCIREAGK